MARQFERTGEEVALLCMMDLWPEENTRRKWLFFPYVQARSVLAMLTGRSASGPLSAPETEALRKRSSAGRACPGLDPGGRSRSSLPMGTILAGAGFQTAGLLGKDHRLQGEAAAHLPYSR